MKLMYGTPDSVPIRASAKYVAGQPQLLVFEMTLPHWGVFHSMEFQIFRDGSATAALDVSTTNIGIKEYPKDNTFRLQFECNDLKFPNAQDHTYLLVGTVHFFTCAAPPSP